MIQRSNKLFFSLSTLFIMYGMLWVSSSCASVSARIGLVKTYEPTAAIFRQGQKLTLSEGAEIFEGDTIETDASGTVGIVFTDGAVLTLGPSGKMTIEDFLFKPAEKQVSFISKIMKGTVAFFSGAINRIQPGAVKFKTPTATLGLRGTRVLIEVD